MKNYASPFAIAGALLIAALLVATNLITTPDVLWCIPPVILLALWPAGVVLCKKKHYTAFSIVGSLLIIACLTALNWITLPKSLWFFYAAPLILCWPVGMLLGSNMRKLPFSLLMAVFIAAYCLALNFWLTPHVFWAMHPIFIALWWPLSLYCYYKHAFTAFSFAGSLLTIAYLIGCNLLSTSYPWALFVYFPIIIWPLSMLIGKLLGAFKFSVIASLAILAWYGALNIFLERGSPWIIFVTFALLWWPISVRYYGRHRKDIYAVVMTIISFVFFSAVNLIYSPDVVWSFYPAFALLWWPLSVIFYGKHRPDIYAAVMTLLSIAFFVAINIIYSPGVVWSFYPAFALLWWPLTVLFARRRAWRAYSLVASLITIAFFATINLLTSPSFLWFIFPSFCILWWPTATFFTKLKNPLVFSIAGSLLVIALVASVNLITSPGFLWCAFPIFGILWWPLGVFFHSSRKHRLSES